MRRSNFAVAIFAKGLSITAFALILSACNLPEPKETKEGDGSTFAITSFEGKVNSRILNQKTGLPSSNVYNYKVCLTDLRQKKPMIGNKFEISEVGQSLATDASGCLTWSETLEYNYLAASKYLKFTRTVKGLGPHFGLQTVNFALDPWSHGEANAKDAIDLSKNTLPSDFLLQDQADVKMSLMGNSVRQKKVPSQLWLNMSRLAAVEDRITGKGFEINYDFQATPQLKLNKMTGEQTFTDLTSGSLKGKLSLIHVVLENGKMKRTVLTSKEFPNLQIDNKIVAMGAHYNFEAPYWGHLYLAIQLTPTNELSDLAPFEGVFYLGDYRSVNAGGFLLLSSLVQKNPNFTIDQFLAGKYPINTDDETAPSKTSTAPSTTSFKRGEAEDFSGKNLVAIPALTFGAPRIEEDMGHHRVLKFQSTACLINPITQQVMRGQNIKITPFTVSNQEPSKKVIPVTSQIDGCVSWPDEIAVNDAYGCQRFIKGTVGFKNEDLGIDRKINVFINPWDDSFQVGVDELRYRNLLGHECDDDKSLEKPSYLFMNAIQYTLLKVRHDMDTNLNISVIRDLQLDLDVTVVNNSKLHGPRDGAERLRDAMYLVKSVLTENPSNTKDPQFISSSSNIVQSTAGRISVKDLSFKFHHLLDMGNRNRLMFQVLPVDANKVTLSADLKSFVPKAGLSMDDVVDNGTRLLPLVYEAKIILFGAERMAANLVDSQKPLMAAVMDGKKEFQPAFKKLIEERKVLMSKLVAQGLKAQAQEENTIAAKSGIVDYARQNSTILIDTNQPESKNFKYLQKLLSFDVTDHYRHAMGFKKVDAKTNLARSIIRAAPLAKDQIIKLLSAPQLSADVAKRICFYFFTELVAPALKKESIDDAPAMCADPLQAVKNLLIREKVYHVNKFDSFDYNIGNYESLSISNSFAQSYSFTNSHTHTVSTSMGAKVPDFLIFSVGGQTSISSSKASSESSANSVTLTNNLPLTYQVSETQFQLRDYETCYRLRLNPNLFIEKNGIFELFNFNKISFFGYLDQKKSYQEVFGILNRGLLICDRPQQMKPIKKFEKIYVIQQDPKEGEYQDKADAKNRYLFMTLRGEDQFKQFEALAKSEVSSPSGSRLQDLNSEQANQRLLNVFNTKPWAPRIYVEPLLEN